MALTAPIQRSRKVHTLRLTALPVQGGATIYTGALTAIDEATGLAVPAADAAGLIIKGFAHRGFENSEGSDGVLVPSPARFCEVDDNGPYSVRVSGSTPRAGQRAFVVDDDQVSADPQTHNVDAGQFVEPDTLNHGHWFVDVER